jgi:hypothetical protein
MRSAYQFQRQPAHWPPRTAVASPETRSRSLHPSGPSSKPSQSPSQSLNPHDPDAEQFAREALASPWDFSKISVLSSGRLAGHRAPHRSAVTQPRLALVQVDDPLEREARCVADQAVGMPHSNLSVSGQLTRLGQESVTRGEAESQAQRLSSPAASAKEPLLSVYEVLRAPGQPLDASVRAFMEPRFGYDFSHVRVHVDTAAAESARSVNARAYTVGSHVAFGAGQYAPEKESGRKLLMHELTHTIQQSAIYQDASGQPATLPLLRQAADTSELPKVDRDVETMPHLPTPPVDQRSPIQKRLDEFLNRMIAVYQTPDGNMAAVAPPFGMGNGYPGQKAKAEASYRQQHLKSIEKKNPHISQFIGRVQLARGSADEIHTVTQALIDDGALETEKDNGFSESSLDQSIRLMMFNYRIGTDCAGYVQQAYLSATGTGRRAAHFKDIGNEDLGESTPDLASRGYLRIDDPSAALPGDLVVLDIIPPDRPPGHRAIVYSRREATESEKQELTTTKKLPATFVPAGASVYVLELDSSWGSGGDPQRGGVQRRTFWYSPAGTPKWAWSTSDPARFASGDQPYDHRLRGFYRSKTP